jgi:hypothetical protein
MAKGVLMGASGFVHLENVTIVRETDKAFLCLLDDGEETWIPKSQVADSDNYSAGDERITLSITDFIAKEKGLG